MAHTAKFWDRMAKRYSKQPIADETSYQKKLEITREYFSKESQVFEFGCGTGSTAILHAPFVSHIHAIDISEKMIEIANEKLKGSAIKNITFEKNTIDAFDNQQPYDVVMAMSILHLVEDREAVLDKVFNMLKPGGVFVSSTVCLSGMWPLKIMLAVGNALGVLPSVRFFNQDNLAKAIINAGFQIEKNWLPGKGKAVFIVARKPS